MDKHLQLLEIICSELNVKQLEIEYPCIPDFKLVFYYDTIKEKGDGLQLFYKGEAVEAPKTTAILLNLFLSPKVER